MTLLDPVLNWIAALALALVLGRGALAKLTGFARFRAAVATYRILPGPLVPVFAVVLVAAEVASAGLLLISPLRLAGALGAVLVLAVVSAGVWINLRRGRHAIECGCGGPGQTISSGLLWRNLGLALLAVLAAIPSGTRTLGLADAVMVAAGGLMWAGLFDAADRLIAAHALLRRSRL